MNNKIALMLAAGALVAGAQQASAIGISGTIQMNGSTTLDSTSLATATQASFNPLAPDAFVTSGTGSFAVVPAFPALTPVEFNNFQFTLGANVVNDLWSFTSGGLTYSFDLGSITSIAQDSGSLEIRGLGTLQITGLLSPYTDTAANWSFEITDTANGGNSTFVFAFADSNTAAVPDGGATAALLGAGLLGMAAVRRKIS